MPKSLDHRGYLYVDEVNLLEKEGSHIYENQTKKEVQMLNRERIKLSDQHRGIKDMRRLPDAIIVVDAKLEFTAVKEANGLGIPIIAIVDSNTNPNNISYPIPANDDSIRTIQLLISSIADTILEANGKLNDNNTPTDQSNISDADNKQDSITPTSDNN